jgi:DNA-binding SARP family transcriptional activator
VSPVREPIRVFTLGSFRVERDGEPAVLGRRSPPRQLELLQAIIALGGTSAAQTRLADALWPEAEGDASMHALETTVYRLRRTFGAEAIRVCAGQVSLSRDLWWVDLVEFRALASEVESALIEGRGVQPSLGNRLFDVYRGDFLPDVEAPWAVATRRLQRSRMSALCARLSRSWDLSGTAVLAENVRHRAAERVPAEIAVPGAHGPL